MITLLANKFKHMHDWMSCCWIQVSLQGTEIVSSTLPLKTWTVLDLCHVHLLETFAKITETTIMMNINVKFFHLI